MLEMERFEIDAMLDAARVGRLCLATADGRPYCIPLPFLWHGEALYLRVAPTGRKGAILAENDRVCFEVDAFTDRLDEYASVLVEGRLVEVDDLEEKARVRELNKAKYLRLRGGYRPGHRRRTPLDRLVMRKIVVADLSGRRRSPLDAPRVEEGAI